MRPVLDVQGRVAMLPCLSSLSVVELGMEPSNLWKVVEQRVWVQELQRWQHWKVYAVPQQEHLEAKVSI